MEKIATVGAEDYIMEHFPYDKYRFRILTVERPDEKLSERLISQGYEKVCKISSFGETLWVSTLEKASLDLSTPALIQQCHR